MGKLAARDALTGKDLEVNGGKVRTHLPKTDYTVIEFERD